MSFDDVSHLAAIVFRVIPGDALASNYGARLRT